jgi:pimeloyl-ACP methyl ester carboxylesterase
LIGWSWGTITMATYTTQHPDKVERLILYAPGWILQTPSPFGPNPIAAYRQVTREQAMQRWMMGVPDNKKATLIPAGWFDAWADVTWATDPEGAQANPPYLRAPNGVIEDFKDYWAAYYEPRSRFRHCWCRQNGIEICRPIWRRHCSRCL